MIPRIPERDLDGEWFTFDAAHCPFPESQVVVPDLHMLPGAHEYGESTRIDMIVFWASKQTYRGLGLLMLASVFKPNRELVVVPAHPQTQLKKFTIECGNAGGYGLLMVPNSYGYNPAPVESNYPFWYSPSRDGMPDSRKGYAAHDFASFTLKKKAAVSRTRSGRVVTWQS